MGYCNTTGLKNIDFFRTLNLLFSHLILSQLTPAMCILYYFCILQCVFRISLTKTLCSCSSYHRSSVIRLHLCGLRKHLVQSRVSLSGNHTSVFYRNSIIASEKLRQSNDLFTFQKYICIYMRIEAKRVRSQLLHKLELHPRPAIMFGSWGRLGCIRLWSTCMLASRGVAPSSLLEKLRTCELEMEAACSEAAAAC